MWMTRKIGFCTVLVREAEKVKRPILAVAIALALAACEQRAGPVPQESERHEIEGAWRVTKYRVFRNPCGRVSHRVTPAG